MSETGNAVDISVCICTFKRPQLLERLLQAVAAQQRGTLRLQVVVVDNDPAHSAQAVLHRWQARDDIVITAVHVAEPNIARARNAAVHAARAPWVVFVDDDEEPVPGWLQCLLQAQAQYGADAVFGPVLPRYRQDTPRWIREGGYFDRPRHRTGTPITTRDARTGNVLIRRDAMMALDGPFDPAYGRTGGEDTVMFGALLDRGATLVWCDEAPVEEDVPADRATLGWILRRAYRGGQTYMRAELKRLRGGRRAMRGAYLAARAAGQAALAGLLALACLPVSRTRAVQWLRTASANAGKLTALGGRQYQEYGH
ncbi:glycosyltransferase family 2 protein [Bordetella genomosp. 13]|uniref:glycosyltransferase family 2 protein n=1 Tax=Bordetella genomosp. 13 TaxID=463040 RepID=UPI0021B6DEC4|nr:glycosyltransferase family 2 protein [Bordetella genomosp. 13]